MKSLVMLKIAGFISLLMAFSTVSRATTEQSSEHLCFGLGIFVGGLLTLLLALYLSRRYQRKYQKMLRQLKSAKRNTRIAEQMNRSVE